MSDVQGGDVGHNGTAEDRLWDQLKLKGPEELKKKLEPKVAGGGVGWHRSSTLTNLHVMVLESQKKRLDRYAAQFERSQGDLVREALTYLFDALGKMESGGEVEP